MNRDQKCIEVTNVDDWLFVKYFEYIPTSGS